MSRLIDADAMLKRLEEWNTHDKMDKALYNFAKNRVVEQPTVNNWIPVSERLPENDSLAVVVAKIWNITRGCDIVYYLSRFEDGNWTKTCRGIVLGWMPISAYEGE